MHIPKTDYQRKPTAHGENTIKEVILDKSHLPHLLQFAKSYFKKGDSLDSHSHDSMSEIFYVPKGKVRVIYGEVTFIANEGDSFYLKAKIKHRFDFIEDTEFIYFCLEDYKN